MDRARYVELFLAEAAEGTATVDRLLLEMEDGVGAERVEDLFRAVHTLKGMAAAMACRTAAALAHAVEHRLDELRSGSAPIESGLIDLLLAANDAFRASVEAEIQGNAPPPETARVLSRFLGGAEVERRPWIGGPAQPGEDASATKASIAPPSEGPELEVQVRIRGDAVLPAARAMLVLRRAREIGSVTEVSPAESTLLGGELRGPLSFTLHAALPAAEVELELESVGEVEEVRVEERSRTAPAAAAGRATGDAAAGGMVRISQAQLDDLLDQMSELVIARDRLRSAIPREGSPALRDAAHDLSRLVGQLRDEVLHLRTVPARELLDRFPRVVRDDARASGKRVEFRVEGGDVPLDRSLLNQLGDMLIHLLRNAVGHGIERPEERRAAGKPEVGRVTLAVSRSGGEATVHVVDDGRGISRERVQAVARERGLLGGGEAAQGEDLLHLITTAGFTTAEEVTSLSGRGVGLDVVASHARRLGGTLLVETEEGVGTTFVLRVPLTRSIQRAIQLRLGEERFQLPIAGVTEVLELPASAVVVEQRRESISVGGGRIPLLRLGGVLGIPVEETRGSAMTIVIVGSGERRIGCLVDATEGSTEIAAKSFLPPHGAIDLFQGATILPDGAPSLILDPAKLTTLELHRVSAPEAA